MSELRTSRGIRIFQRVALIVTSAVIAVNFGAAALNVISPGTAVILFFAVELPLGFVAICVGLLRYQSLRKMGLSHASAFESVAGKTIATAIGTEIAVYRSLWLWVRGKRDGATASVRPFGYSRGVFATPIAFCVVTLVEVVAVHLLLPWAWLRIVLLIASLYGLLLLGSFAAGRVVHPHLLARDELSLREGAYVVAVIPVASIAMVRASKRFDQTFACEQAGRLYLASADGTNIDIALSEDREVRIPGLLKRQRRTVAVRSVSVYVDDPVTFVAAVQEARAARDGRAVDTEA